MKDLILIGGGGHCKACIDVIETLNDYNIIGILDVPEKVGSKVLGYDIIGTDDQLSSLMKSCNNFLITIGQIGFSKRRVELFNTLQDYKLQLPTIISRNAYVSKHSKIGAGTIIMHKCIVNANTTIGNNCIINNSAQIEHDVIIKNHCHISTGAILNGGVEVDDFCFVGSNAVCIGYTKLVENSFVKAGSIFKG